MAEEFKSKSSIADQFKQACVSNSINEVKRLIDSGFDVNIKDTLGCTPLFYITAMSQLQLARFLISSGASLSQTNNNGETPLHVAARQSSKELLLVYLLNGADPSVLNYEGRSAEDLSGNLKPIMIAMIQVKEIFDQLKTNQKQRLESIFQEIDEEGLGFLNLEKSVKFNRFIEEVPEEVAKKDAQDFIRDVSICSKGIVYLEEWLIAFAKLASEKGEQAVDSFIEEYDKAVRERGKFSDFIPRG